jgi:hypothetical protein
MSTVRVTLVGNAAIPCVFYKSQTRAYEIQADIWSLRALSNDIPEVSIMGRLEKSFLREPLLGRRFCESSEISGHSKMANYVQNEAASRMAVISIRMVLNRTAESVLLAFGLLDQRGTVWTGVDVSRLRCTFQTGRISAD